MNQLAQYLFDHATQMNRVAAESHRPVKTSHQFSLPDSAGNQLLSYDSGDREPFYVVNHFHTRKSLVELRYAIEKALAEVERIELGERLAGAKNIGGALGMEVKR